MSKDTEPMSVENTGFLLDRLGKDCHPLQQYRELTVNSIQAVEDFRKIHPDLEFVGDIFWTVDEEELSRGRRKLCIVDNGIGMYAAEMKRHLNQLSSSGRGQSMETNFGVGAKISAATRNPEGVMYFSKRDNQSVMYGVTIHKDEDGEYGLCRYDMSGEEGREHYDPVFEVSEDSIPQTIKSVAHGTKVVLLGKNLEDDTTVPPDGTPYRSKFLTYYLYNRFFRIPDYIRLRVIEHFGEEGTRPRNVYGIGKYLDERATHKGTLQLTKAKAHWWITDFAAGSKGRGSYDFFNSRGHVGCLYQNEIYEMTYPKESRHKLQRFGVTFGQNRVVIYIEPDVDQDITTNTARTSILINSEPLPWDAYSDEFYQNMPQEIREFVRKQAEEALGTGHLSGIWRRLKKFRQLFAVSRYKDSERGKLRADGVPIASVVAGDEVDTQEVHPRGPRHGVISPVTPSKNKRGRRLPPHASPVGKRVEPIETMDALPKPVWVSNTEPANSGKYRDKSDMEDRAARYVPQDNTIRINADFRVFADMEGFLTEGLEEVGDRVREVAREVMRGWYEQYLIEAVLGIQSLANDHHWGQTDVEKALSEEALTSVVMLKHGVYESASREVKSRLGPLARAAINAAKNKEAAAVTTEA